MTKTSEGGAARAARARHALNIFAAMDAWGPFRSDGRKPPPGGDEAVAWYLEGLDRKRMRAVADELLADARVPRGGERMDRAHASPRPLSPGGAAFFVRPKGDRPGMFALCVKEDVGSYVTFLVARSGKTGEPATQP